jgi:hypothetical protein
MVSTATQASPHDLRITNLTDEPQRPSTTFTASASRGQSGYGMALGHCSGGTILKTT